MDDFEGKSPDQTETFTNFKEYFWLLFRWSWLIALVGFLFAISTYIFSKMQTPIYQVSTTVLVDEGSTAQRIDYNYNSFINDQVILTYTNMLTKTPLLRKAFERLNMPFDTSVAVNASPVKDTQMFSIQVQDTDPERAAILANEIVVVFTEQLREIQASRYKASKDNLQTQLKYLETQIADSSTALDKANQASKPAEGAPANPIPVNQAEIDRLETRLAQYRQIYASVLSSYEEIRLAEAQTTTSFVQVEPAVPSQQPIRPQTFRNTLLAALAGMLLAISGVIGINLLDDTITNPETVSTQLGLPILATISEHVQKDGQPIAQSSPRSPVAEAFRSLRTNVQFSSVDAPLKRIMITSPTPEDGKTTISTNLAVVLAQSGKRVTLIDADLRKPQIHRMLGLDNILGLSSLFVQPVVHLNGNLQITKTDGLKALSSGDLPPNPSELLGSKKMNEILGEIELQSDVIILDTPPVLSVTDAAVLSSLADGVVLVVKVGKTKLAALAQSVEQLRQVNAKLIGIVLNEVNPRKLYYYRNYGYYKSAKYYYEEDPKENGKKKAAPVVENSNGGSKVNIQSGK